MDNKFQAHYTALKILKQRCEYLQQKLDSVEEENCQLKLQKVQKQDKSVKKNSINNGLEEQITTLNKQNSRMFHQLQLVTTENQNLWSQLSKLMSGNDALGDTLSVSSVSTYVENQKLHETNKIIKPLSNLLDDCSKESLEEISLKLISGLLIGKNELESQYSQMIDLQKESNLSEKSNFSKLSSQFDCSTTLNIMRGAIQKMKDFKEVLFQQKIDLGNAITAMKNYENFAQSNLIKNYDNNVDHVNTIDPVSNALSPQVQDRLSEDDISESDKTCPMCARNFKGSFNNFHKHVTSHFEDGNEEFVSATFELSP